VTSGGAGTGARRIGKGAAAMVAAGGKLNRHAHVLLQQEQQRVKTLTDQHKDRRRNKCCSLPDCIGQNALLAEEPNASVISASCLRVGPDGARWQEEQQCNYKASEPTCLFFMLCTSVSAIF
jgi:hypothetical protein